VPDRHWSQEVRDARQSALLGEGDGAKTQAAFFGNLVTRVIPATLSWCAGVPGRMAGSG